MNCYGSEGQSCVMNLVVVMFVIGLLVSGVNCEDRSGDSDVSDATVVPPIVDSH